jgi:ribosomal subunit interface protein
MNINFKTRGADITNDIKQYAQEKAQMLIKLLGNEADAPEARFDIEFSEDPKHISGDVFRVDMVAITSTIDMHAVGHGASMNAAIDQAKDDLARRLRRAKGKERNLLRKGSRMIKKMLRMQE